MMRVPESGENKRNAAWVVWIVAIVSLALLVVVFFPVFGGSGGGAAKRTQDLAGLKQIAMSLSIYMVDFDDRFPPDMSSVRGGLKYFGEALHDRRVMRSIVPGSPEYLGNGSLACKKTADIAEPDRLIGFFDSAPFPDKHRVVMFADTSCRTMMESDFQEAVANLWQWEPPKAKP